MPRRVGAYAKLLANYAQDDAIIAAGEKAELLFIRGLAFCATADSDGYITDGQVERVVGAGMRDARARARALVEHGLWEQADGGYQVRSWVKIHESAEEKGRIRRTDRERKRAERATESVRSPVGQESDSEPSPAPVTSESLDCSYVSTSPTTEQSNPIQSSAPAQPDTTPRKRGHRLPDNWRPTTSDVEWARTRGITDDQARRSTERFTNHWMAAAGQNARKLDWSRAWRNWLDSDAERSAQHRPPTATDKIRGIYDAGEQAKALIRQQAEQHALPGA